MNSKVHRLMSYHAAEGLHSPWIVVVKIPLCFDQPYGCNWRKEIHSLYIYGVFRNSESRFFQVLGGYLLWGVRTAGSYCGEWSLTTLRVSFFAELSLGWALRRQRRSFESARRRIILCRMVGSFAWSEAAVWRSSEGLHTALYSLKQCILIGLHVYDETDPACYYLHMQGQFHGCTEIAPHQGNGKRIGANVPLWRVHLQFCCRALSRVSQGDEGSTGPEPQIKGTGAEVRGRAPSCREGVALWNQLDPLLIFPR